MAIIGIVAVDQNGAIGKGGRLPWHYAADMKFFKEQTINNACVLGYRTWLTLKKPLRDRLNIVMSRSRDVTPQESVILLRDRLSVLSLKNYLACDLYIIGGAEIYQTFLGDIERWLVTYVPLSIQDADAFMPRDFLQGFAPIEQKQLDVDLAVTIYERA